MLGKKENNEHLENVLLSVQLNLRMNVLENKIYDLNKKMKLHKLAFFAGLIGATLGWATMIIAKNLNPIIYADPRLIFILTGGFLGAINFASTRFSSRQAFRCKTDLLNIITEYQKVKAEYQSVVESINFENEQQDFMENKKPTVTSKQFIRSNKDKTSDKDKTIEK